MMIQTADRDPQQAYDDVNHCYFEALRHGVRPYRIEMGFFQVRDIRDLHTPDWRKRGMQWPGRAIWVPILHYETTPCYVAQLEDRVRLFCLTKDGRSVEFEVDRRSSQAEPI